MGDFDQQKINKSLNNLIYQKDSLVKKILLLTYRFHIYMKSIYGTHIRKKLTFEKDEKSNLGKRKKSILN